MSATDRTAIEGLVARYADLIDGGDLDGVGALFAHGRLVTPDGLVLAEGADAVAALYRATTRLHDDGTPRTAHLVTNLVVDVAPDRDTATARSRFTVLQSPPDVDPPRLEPIITGSYRDAFTRLDGRWWFAERAMVPHLLGDLSAHLLLDPTTLGTEPPTLG